MINFYFIHFVSVEKSSRTIHDSIKRMKIRGNGVEFVAHYIIKLRLILRETKETLIRRGKISSRSEARKGMVCFLIDFSSFPTDISLYVELFCCFEYRWWQQLRSSFFEEIFRESCFTKPVNCIIPCTNIKGWKEISTLVFIAEVGKGSRENGEEKTWNFNKTDQYFSSYRS